jgi:hypothetical protein
MPMSMKGAGFKKHSKVGRGVGTGHDRAFSSRGNYPKKQLKKAFKRNSRLPNEKVISAMRKG